MFEAIASLATRRGWIIVAGWAALVALLYATAPPWESVTRDDDVRFFPEGFPSVVGQELLERGFPDDSASSQAVVIAERRAGPLIDADFQYVDQIVRTLDRLRDERPDLGIKQVVGHRTPVLGPRLIGSRSDGPGQAVLTRLSLRATYQAKEARVTVDAIQAALDDLPPPPEGMALGLTGSAVVGHDMNAASKQSVDNTTRATIVLVIAILLLVYRSPLLALLPLLTIALSVWAALKGIALMTENPFFEFRVINITNIFVIVVLFGAGTDYCLFLIARYREELARGRTGDEALREAIRKVGGALVASAGTVICGLGMLWFSSFAKIQYTGPSIALSLIVALVASLTLAPVLLHWLRGAVFWPFRPPHHTPGADREAEGLATSPNAGFWFKVGDVVVRHPGAILAASLLLLVPLAVVGYRTEPSYSQLADLNEDQLAVRGAKLIQSYFPVGELSPATILVAHPKLDFLAPEGREAIASVSADLAGLPNVAEVRSLSQPLGEPLAPPVPEPDPAEASSPIGLFRRFQRQGVQAVVDQGAKMVRAMMDAYYVSTRVQGADRDHVARFDIVFRSDPFAPESLETLETIHRTVLGATRSGGVLEGAETVGLAGSTAMVGDLREVTRRDERQMYWLVTLAVYLVLVLLIRRPGICLYLIFTVVLGYLASLGITEMVFRAFHDGPEPWQGLDWKVGFFLFVILVAVGEDYNILLMARVLEEERKHGPIEGTRLAVAHTGGIISSCGLIMAGTFGSMLAASLTALRELGFALALGVLLDTFIVRPILVPAFIVLIHRNRGAKAGAADDEALDQSPLATTPAP